MELAYFLILFALAVSSIQADRINMLEIKTSDCDDCGMGHFGELRAEVRIRYSLHKITKIL